MADTLHTTPSKEECWTEFWDFMGPALVRAYREGRFPAEDYRETAAAAAA